MTYSNALK